MAKIFTPVKGFTGQVVGVSFVDGEGSTTDEKALDYFERHDYKIEGRRAKAAAKTETKTKGEGDSKGKPETKSETAPTGDDDTKTDGKPEGDAAKDAKSADAGSVRTV